MNKRGLILLTIIISLTIFYSKFVLPLSVQSVSCSTDGIIEIDTDCSETPFVYISPKEYNNYSRLNGSWEDLTSYSKGSYYCTSRVFKSSPKSFIPKSGDYNINISGIIKTTHCPGLIFNCMLVDLSIKKCYNNNNSIYVEFFANLTQNPSQPYNLDLYKGILYTVYANNRYMDINKMYSSKGSLPEDSIIKKISNNYFSIEKNFDYNITIKEFTMRFEDCLNNDKYPAFFTIKCQDAPPIVPIYKNQSVICSDVSFKILDYTCYNSQTKQLSLGIYNNGKKDILAFIPMTTKIIRGADNSNLEDESIYYNFINYIYIKPNEIKGFSMDFEKFYNYINISEIDYISFSPCISLNESESCIDSCPDYNYNRMYLIKRCDNGEIAYNLSKEQTDFQQPQQEFNITQETTTPTIESIEVKEPEQSNIKKYILIILIIVVIVIFVVFFLKKVNLKKIRVTKEYKETKKDFIEKEKIFPGISDAIKVTNFSVRHSNKVILENVNLKIQRGTFVSLIGPAGTGKSTIIEAIVGRKKPNSGKITIFERSINDKSILQYVGFVPQSPEIYMNQTVINNLITTATKWGIKNPKEKAEKILSKLNLINRKDITANKLSGGQTRLLSLAMELIRDPELLVLDEPTTGLDPNSRNQIITILSSLVNYDHKTVLITTHFMDDAEECDEVILVGNKKILAQGSPTKLEKMLPGGGRVVNIILDNVTDDLLKKIDKIEGIKEIIREGRALNILTDDPNPIKVGNKITELGGVVNETKLSKATMKEVFVYFTGINPEDQK